MRWVQSLVTVLFFSVLTGCPSEFGKDGRVAKAIHKDEQDRSLTITQCSDNVRRKACAHGKEHSDECLKCGGP